MEYEPFIKMTAQPLRHYFCCIVAVLFSLQIALAENSTAGASSLSSTLWYQQPATRWLDALPIGNGRVGAMVFAGVGQDRMALNESTLWSGGPSSEHENPDGSAHLAEIREALFADNYKKANPLINKFLLGRELNYGTNLALGDLILDMAGSNQPVKEYRRELDMAHSLAKVSYSSGAVHYNREYLASNPAGVLAIRLTCDQPKQISFTTHFAIPLPGETTISNEQTLERIGHAFEKNHSDGKSGVAYKTVLRVVTEGGTYKAQGEQLEINKADSATLYIAINTDYHGRDPKSLCETQIAGAVKSGYEKLRADHVADVQVLFNRVSLNLGNSDTDPLPTDERLKRFRGSLRDPAFEAQFFQYGRYLLIAGSRADSPLPTHLQGIWNDGIASSFGWTCDMHLDINAEQNYWPAEVCNLSSCAEPLFEFIESLRAPGRLTAKKVYNCDGWVCHWATNAWGFTAPGWGSGWGLEDVGGAWIASHLWDHYAFGGDRNFLADRAYPVLKEAAQFYLQYLTVDPRNGYLVSGPSPSCENSFKAPDGTWASESMGCTHDRIILYALFSDCIEAAKTLNVDADFRAKLEAAQLKFPPFKIGKHGQIQEWLEDYDEAIPNHRHTSHLLGLYPFDQISVRTTPDLAKAVVKTLDRRMNRKNWEDVEWSRANAINYYARLCDGSKAEQSLGLLIAKLSDTNLFTISPKGIAGAPDNVFAVDGNEAGAAGVAEMLLQSQSGEIQFLPALPDVWPEGSVKGLCARGGFTIDEVWKNKTLARAAVLCSVDGVCRIRSSTPIEIRSHNSIVEPRHPQKDVVEIDGVAGQLFQVTPLH